MPASFARVARVQYAGVLRSKKDFTPAREAYKRQTLFLFLIPSGVRMEYGDAFNLYHTRDKLTEELIAKVL